MEIVSRPMELRRIHAFAEKSSYEENEPCPRHCAFIQVLDRKGKGHDLCITFIDIRFSLLEIAFIMKGWQYDLHCDVNSGRWSESAAERMSAQGENIFAPVCE